jgi:Immunity protein Imm1
MANAFKMLAVTRMEGPEDYNPAELDNPTCEDIEAAIRRLDGDSCSLLILGIGNPPTPHMAIGGGEHGRYIVYATPDNIVFHKLIDPDAGAGKCLMVAGGQRGNYDLELCVSLTRALRAAKSYAETGGLDPTLTWRE